ncbi:hypothetical protein [Enterococcus viikkiensis]|uniref:hypothetical protein n=1 Tax=Enterococcus viikkiensis TaxID=930854 RepID=UPI0010F7E90C|nr:hypothetical protein [Enterococcus viikkiensis]
MEIEELSDELIQYGFNQQMQDFYLLPKKEMYHWFFRRGSFFDYKNTNLAYEKNELTIATALQPAFPNCVTIITRKTAVTLDI